MKVKWRCENCKHWARTKVGGHHMDYGICYQLQEEVDIMPSEGYVEYIDTPENFFCKAFKKEE